MIRFGAAVAVLLLATPAFAQNAVVHQWRHRHVVHAHVVQPQVAAIQPVWTAPEPRLHQHGNSCAPDRPVPVWGDGNAFMGYHCEGESANGS
jgi:hypothetical protein